MVPTSVLLQEGERHGDIDALLLYTYEAKVIWRFTGSWAPMLQARMGWDADSLNADTFGEAALDFLKVRMRGFVWVIAMA